MLKANWQTIANEDFKDFPRSMKRVVFKSISSNFRHDKRRLTLEQLKSLYGEYFLVFFEIHTVGKFCAFFNQYHWQTFKSIRFDILRTRAAA